MISLQNCSKSSLCLRSFFPLDCATFQMNSFCLSSSYFSMTSTFLSSSLICLSLLLDSSGSRLSLWMQSSRYDIKIYRRQFKQLKHPAKLTIGCTIKAINITNMQSQTNTSRLHKMSRITGSIRRSSISSFDGKDNFKLAAINSIRRGIKNNDVSLITKGDFAEVKQSGGNTIDLASFRTQDSFDKVRKEFDVLQKEKTQTEKLLTKMKEEVENAKAQQQLYSNKKDGASKTVQELESILEDKRQFLEQSTIDKKCFTHILNRLRADRVTHGEKKYNLQTLLSEMKKQYSIINKESFSKEQEVYRATGIKQALRRQIEDETRQREEHLKSIVAQIQLLRQTVEVDEARQREVKQIRERAYQDKSEDERQWKQLLQTHQFVSRLLTNKMDKEMDRFKVVESAFKNIKLATGVSDVQSIVSKYLNREQVYGRLLDNIAQKEKKIEELKKNRAFLEKEFKEQNDGPQLVQAKKREVLNKQLKNLDTTAEKKVKSELEKSKFAMWIKKQIKKIEKVEHPEMHSQAQHHNVQHIEPNKDDLEMYITWLEKQLSMLQTADVEVPADLGRDFEFSPQHVMRVKSQQSEEEQQSHLHMEDTNYLNAERHQRLKQNQKFMRELKRKKEQELKQQIELAVIKKPAASPNKKEKQEETD